MENFHEDLKDHYIAPDLTNRTFGLFAGGILSVLGLVKLLAFGWWLMGSAFLVIGASLLLLSLFRPLLLDKPKTIFLGLTPKIAAILNPVLMGFIYVICFIPAGYILKLLKRDPLNRTWQPYSTTYWSKRGKHELPNPMKYQF